VVGVRAATGSGLVFREEVAVLAERRDGIEFRTFARDASTPQSGRLRRIQKAPPWVEIF
jgi:hypothetical protein